MIIFGVILAVISLGADVIGIGKQITIGWKQFLGIAIGNIGDLERYCLNAWKLGFISRDDRQD
jgi:hypothetical protein